MKDPISDTDLEVRKIKKDARNFLYSSANDLYYTYKGNLELQPAKRIIDMKVAPRSKHLMEIFHAEQPIRLRYYTDELSEIQTKNIIEDHKAKLLDQEEMEERMNDRNLGISFLTFPSLKILGDEPFFFWASDDTGKRMGIRIEVMQEEKSDLFGLPMGFHGDCYECPHAYDKTIESLTRKGLQMSGDHVIFRCDIDLCQGVKDKYQHELVYVSEESFKQAKKDGAVVPHENITDSLLD